MRVVRASELGEFLYCQRSWWYRLRGEKPANQADLRRGSQFHHAHHRSLVLSRLLWVAAAALLLIALYLFFTLR